MALRDCYPHGHSSRTHPARTAATQRLPHAAGGKRRVKGHLPGRGEATPDMECPTAPDVAARSEERPPAANVGRGRRVDARSHGALAPLSPLGPKVTPWRSTARSPRPGMGGGSGVRTPGAVRAAPTPRRLRGGAGRLGGAQLVRADRGLRHPPGQDGRRPQADASSTQACSSQAARGSAD